MNTKRFDWKGTRLRVLAGTVLAVGVTLALGAQAAPALSGQALVDRYRQCWALFNQRNWAEFATCYGPKSVSVAPGLPDAKGGTAILDKHARPIVVAFPDIAGELQLVIADGKRVMSVALMQGTHTGPLAGPGGSIPATGKKLGQLVAHGVEASGTTTAGREWFIQDAGTMMAQLGLSPAPARPALARGAGTTQVVLATGSAQEKANLAAARKLYAAFNTRDKGMSEMVTDDVVDRNQSMPKDVVGKAAVTQFISGFWQMSSDVKVAMPAMWARATTWWRWEPSPGSTTARCRRWGCPDGQEVQGGHRGDRPLERRQAGRAVAVLQRHAAGGPAGTAAAALGAGDGQALIA
jgi:predicted ester cyclase